MGLGPLEESTGKKVIGKRRISGGWTLMTGIIGRKILKETTLYLGSGFLLTLWWPSMSSSALVFSLHFRFDLVHIHIVGQFHTWWFDHSTPYTIFITARPPNLNLNLNPDHQLYLNIASQNRLGWGRRHSHLNLETTSKGQKPSPQQMLRLSGGWRWGGLIAVRYQLPVSFIWRRINADERYLTGTSDRSPTRIWKVQKLSGLWMQDCSACPHVMTNLQFVIFAYSGN